MRIPRIAAGPKTNGRKLKDQEKKFGGQTVGGAKVIFPLNFWTELDSNSRVSIRTKRKNELIGSTVQIKIFLRRTIKKPKFPF